MVDVQVDGHAVFLYLPARRVNSIKDGCEYPLNPFQPALALAEKAERERNHPPLFQVCRREVTMHKQRM
jgi:hypothetical protein